MSIGSMPHRVRKAHDERDGAWLVEMLDTKKAILSLTAVELVAKALRRLWNRELPWLWLAICSIALIPWIVEGILALVGPGARGPSLGWMGIYTLALIWLLAAGQWVRARLRSIAGTLDDLLVTEEDRMAIKHVFDVNLRVIPQLFICVLLTAMSVTATVLADHNYLSGHNKPGAGWYVASGFVTFFAVDAISWAVRLPFILVKLRSLGRLRVLARSPVSTAGIRDLSDFLAKLGAHTTGGLALFAIPLWWPVLFDTPKPDKTLAIMSAVPFVISLLVVGWVTVGSQLLVSELVSDSKNRILDGIAKRLPKDPDEPGDLTPDQITLKMKLYDEIAATSSKTMDARVILKQATALAVATGPLLVSFIKGVAK